MHDLNHSILCNCNCLGASHEPNDISVSTIVVSTVLTAIVGCGVVFVKRIGDTIRGLIVEKIDTISESNRNHVSTQTDESGVVAPDQIDERRVSLGDSHEPVYE